MWKSNMMLGISDACLNPTKDPRIEEALGLRLTVLLYASGGHSAPSPLALDAGGVGGGGAPGLGTQSTQEEGIELGRVCISLGELVREPRGGPIETLFALTSAEGSAAGVIQVRLWAQQSGLEGGRCVHADSLVCWCVQVDRPAISRHAGRLESERESRVAGGQQPEKQAETRCYWHTA